MKKIIRILTLSFTIFFVSFNCSVNSYTGIIRIKNNTNTAINNIKIEDEIISLYLMPGYTSNYYFFSSLEGQLSSNETKSAKWSTSLLKNVDRDGTYYLNPNYWYSCNIDKSEDELIIYIKKDAQQGNANTEYED